MSSTGPVPEDLLGSVRDSLASFTEKASTARAELVRRLRAEADRVEGGDAFFAGFLGTVPDDLQEFEHSRDEARRAAEHFGLPEAGTS